MTTIHKIAKNTGVLLVGNVAYRLISFIVTIYLAKYLGVGDFGKYNFIFEYLGFFEIITDLGLSNILIREMSRNTNDMELLFGNAYIIKIVLSFLAIILAIITVPYIGYSADNIVYFYVASITLIFISCSDAYRAVFQTTLTMKYDIISKLAYRIISACLILYIVYNQGTFLQIIFAALFSEILRTGLNHIFSKKLINPFFVIKFPLWKFLLKESIPVAFSSVFFLIYHRIDVVMLSMMKGDISVGLYSAAFKLSEPLSLISFALVSSLFPLMSISFKNSIETLHKSYKICLKYIIVLVMPIAFGTTLISNKIILFAYELPYEDSATALEILIWALLFSSINYLLTFLLVSINKQKITTLNMGACVLVNILLNYLLIPQYSYNGASAATVITEIVLLIMNYYFINKYIEISSPYTMYIKPTCACLIMSIVVYYLNNFTNTNVFIIIFIAIIIYSISILKLNFFSNDEVEVVKKIFKI